MVSGDRDDQRRLADLQDADPMAGGDRSHPGRLRGDVGHHLGEDTGGRRVRGVFKLAHLTPVVVVANHADESHDGARRLVAYQLLVLGKQDRLIRQLGTHDTRLHDSNYIAAMRSVEEHQSIVAGLITARPATVAELSDAEGLVLCGDVTATVALPVFDNSAMDGYAVRAEEVAPATAERPVKLPVAEDIPAGRTDIPALEPGTAHRIMTGAPIPAGATAVVPVEATDGRTDVVSIRAASSEGRHIRRAGEDVAAGNTVLRAGQQVTPAVVGLAAALGLHALTVLPRQRVLVVSTGSELVTPGRPLLPGQIYDSNSIMLAAEVREAGAEVVAAATVSDDVAQFTALLGRYAAESDLIVTSGGVSAGAYEVVKDAFGQSGDHGVEFVKVAMQPGMPQGAGRVANTPIITLPGNPVSALVSFEVFIRPPLRAAMGLPAAERPRRLAVLAETLTAPAGKRQFRRGILDAAAGTVVSCGPPGSHHLRWLASANCLLDIPVDVTQIPAGSQVQVWDLS
jgi:molybdopterin molybdotransferase